MSMNLIFTKPCGCHEEFPYQTSTSLTYAVLGAHTREEQLELIRKDLESHGWDEWSEHVFDEIKEMLNDGWKFSMI